MIIDNTKKVNRVTGILNLTQGVWRVMSGEKVFRGALMYSPPSLNVSPQYCTGPTSGVYRSTSNGVGSYGGAYIIFENGSLRTPTLNWDDVEFEFVAKSLDIVIPGSAG